MPALRKQYLEIEVKKILSDLPADKRISHDSYERLEMIYEIAYNQGWKDLTDLLMESKKK